MTWGNLSAKSSNLVILLPIVLSTFSTNDIVVWYLYFTIVSLQLLIDFGFLPTFTRLFSYAYSGLSIKEIQNVKNNKEANSEINWESLEYLFIATKKIYLKLALISFLVAITFGSWMVYEPLSKSSNISEAWMGWFFVITVASFNLYANSLVSLLTGMDKVAIVQRWQMLSSLSAVISSAIVIFFTKSLFYGIVLYFIWYIVNFIINLFLVKKYYKKSQIIIKTEILNTLIKNTIWPTAWKSGLGIGMSMGLIQFSGMVVAKFESSIVSSSYMIGLQIIRAISSFSQAPYYSRLPYFARLYTQNKIEELILVTKNRMQKSFLVFIAMSLFIGLFGNDLLEIIGSNTIFPNEKMWILIGFAFLLERYGAMYLQLYTLTNHIIWHIANGITGVAMVFMVLVLHDSLGIYSYPLAMCIAYGIFFVPYVVQKTYKEYNLNFIKQEKENFISAFILFVISSLSIISIGG
jgi:hypothetical protein